MNSNDPLAWLRTFQAMSPWWPGLPDAARAFAAPAAAAPWPAAAASPWAGLAWPFAAAGMAPASWPGADSGASGGAEAPADVGARLLAQGRRYLELLQGLALPGLVDEEGRLDAGKWLAGLRQLHQQHGKGLAGTAALPWFGAGDGQLLEAMLRSLTASLASSVRNEAGAWLDLPAFGLTREHQERDQALLRAWLDYQAASLRHAELMHGSATRTLEVLESRLADPEAQAPATPRELFDLLVDAAEEAFAELAMSAEFAQLSGELLNAQMRVRAGIQAQVEQVAGQLGLPTRSEVDALGRKVQELKRALRRRPGEAAAPAAADTAPDSGAPPAGKTTARPAGRKTAKSTASAPAKSGSRSTTGASRAAGGAARKAATGRTARPAAKAAAKKSATRAASKAAAGAASRSAAAGKRATARKTAQPVLRSTRQEG